jgi:hypothetical protein
LISWNANEADFGVNGSMNSAKVLLSNGTLGRLTWEAFGTIRFGITNKSGNGGARNERSCGAP